MDDLQKTLTARLGQALDHLESELKKVRSGRASPSLVDGVMVEVYGQQQPLPHIARVLASDARSLSITPYDPSTLVAIAKAIRDEQSLGLNPVDDGKIIRIAIPDMTTERREQLAKLLHSKAEETRVALRNVRHEVLDEARVQQKARALSEDDFKRFDQEVTKQLDGANLRVEQLVQAKEQEIMTV